MEVVKEIYAKLPTEDPGEKSSSQMPLTLIISWFKLD